MKKNIWLLTAMKGSRAFMQSYFVLILPAYMAYFGLHAFAIGLVATASLIVNISYTWLFTRLNHRFGARKLLIAASLLMAASGVLFALVHSVWGMAAAVLGGFVPPSGGVFQDTVEQGLLSQADVKERTRAFSRYGFAAAALGALGSLMSGLPSVFHHLAGSIVAGDRVFFIVYAVVAILLAMLSTAIIDVHADGGASQSTANKRPLRSTPATRSLLSRIAVLYVSDNLGSGLVTSTLMIYWLHTHYGMTAGQLAVLYFGMDVLSAISYPLAERLSRRIGLINTAVWTHLPCSVMLMLIPFLPNIASVFVLFLLRSLFVEMDVPTRQSFIASAVQPHERTAAAGVTSLSEQAGQAFGPAVGGLVLQTASAAVPFVAGGALKVVYDLTLWFLFRKTAETTAEA